MPLFEYACSRCESRFEVLIRNGDRPVCPECGDDAPEKLLSAAASRIAGTASLPVAGGCPPADAPPCSPHCCRL
ncbi:MAG: zinc ribbon domain-containing protein [Planctomycetaceae bacterium]